MRPRRFNCFGIFGRRNKLRGRGEGKKGETRNQKLETRMRKVETGKEKRDSSRKMRGMAKSSHIRRSTLSSRKTVRDAKGAQERKRKKKSACCVRSRTCIRDANDANDSAWRG